jgi:anti-anti-sigma regulatory factor
MGIVTRQLGDVVILDLQGDLMIATMEKVALHQRVKAGLEAGARLKLEKLAAKVRLVFRITGLEGVFEVFDDEEAAIRSFEAF